MLRKRADPKAGAFILPRLRLLVGATLRFQREIATL